VLPKGHQIDVVGESHYQNELLKIAGGRTADGAKNPTATATLVRERTNPYDRNAVAVALVIPGKSEALIVGYLSRELARVFGRELKRIEELGYRGAACEATLTGGWDRGRLNRGEIGVVLDIASKRQVQKYLTGLATNPGVDPDDFGDDTESQVYDDQANWDVPGWIEETDD
jgi:hypothetical protein